VSYAHIIFVVVPQHKFLCNKLSIVLGFKSWMFITWRGREGLQREGGWFWKKL